MKKLLFTAAILMAVIAVNAQTKEGRISFEQKMDMHRRIPAENSQLRSMVPQFRTAKFELLFTDNQSLFKAVEEEPDITEENNGGRIIRFNGGAENEYYKNFSTKKAIEKRDLMEDAYLVEDSIRSLSWKLEDGETKTILEFTCKKASGKSARGTDVLAWYSEDIPVSGGPEQFNGLPGMILCIDGNNGEIVFTATAFDKKVDVKKIKAPTKGTKISNTDFLAKQKELMGNASGGVRIVAN